MSRLFRHDRLIVWNTIRATFVGWHDRVIAALMMLAALAAVHMGFADHPWTIAAWSALAAGVMIGVVIARVVAAYAAWPTVVTFSSIVLSTGVSIGVGLASGLYPAIRASNLNPIDALRNE